MPIEHRRAVPKGEYRSAQHGANLMSTVNFSVPEEVKQAFNETFQGQNKSAVIADLMLEAVERAHSKQRSQEAYRRILARKKRAPTVTPQAFRAAREQGRP